MALGDHVVEDLVPVLLVDAEKRGVIQVAFGVGALLTDAVKLEAVLFGEAKVAKHVSGSGVRLGGVGNEEAELLGWERLGLGLGFALTTRTLVGGLLVVLDRSFVRLLLLLLSGGAGAGPVLGGTGRARGSVGGGSLLLQLRHHLLVLEKLRIDFVRSGLGKVVCENW